MFRRSSPARSILQSCTLEQEIFAKTKVPDLHAIARMWELQPKTLYTFLSATEKTITKIIRTSFRRLSAPISREPLQIMYSERAKIIPILVKQTGYPERFWPKASTSWSSSASEDANSGLSPERVNFTAELMTKVGNIKERQDADIRRDVVDTTFAKKPLSSLASGKGRSARPRRSEIDGSPCNGGRRPWRGARHDKSAPDGAMKRMTMTQLPSRSTPAQSPARRRRLWSKTLVGTRLSSYRYALCRRHPDRLGNHQHPLSAPITFTSPSKIAIAFYETTVSGEVAVLSGAKPGGHVPTASLPPSSSASRLALRWREFAGSTGRSTCRSMLFTRRRWLRLSRCSSCGSGFT